MTSSVGQLLGQESKYEQSWKESVEQCYIFIIWGLENTADSFHFWTVLAPMTHLDHNI